MWRTYEWILRFYPAQFRANFAAEMLQVFDEAIERVRGQGALSLMRFTGREIVGVLAGLVREWIARSWAPDLYVVARSTRSSEPDLPPEILETRRHVQQLIRRMEFAIAHHDFPNARRYSYEERVAREHLNWLMDDHRRRQARAQRAR
jgi:hypothetical protein